MTKLHRQEWIAQRAGAALDLDQVRGDGAAMARLERAGIDAARLTSADRDSDGRLDADEAWRLADDFDRDGARGSLIAVDARGRATPAAEATDALGLLMLNQELLADRASPAPRGDAAPAAPSGPAARLSAATAMLPELGQAFDGQRLRFDPALLDRVEAGLGAGARTRLEGMAALVNHNQQRSDVDKLTLVNDFFHTSVYYSRDAQNSGQRDYWQSPFETLATGTGDCEDYALGKYATLRMLGLEAEQLEIAVVRSREGGHAVLLAHPRERQEPLILDNLNIELRPPSRRRDLTPLLLMNERGGSAANLGRWTRAGVTRPVGTFSKLDSALQRSRGLLPSGALP